MVKLVGVELAGSADAFTHAGVFHADEVLATAMLELALGDFTLCRTFRVPDCARKDALVYDIGCGKYDHHQRGGNGRRGNGVPYASAGLVWRDFGYRAIGESCDADAVWEEVDRTLVRGVDAADNGISLCDGDIAPFDFTRIVSNMNPTWDGSESSDEMFSEALGLARLVLNRAIRIAEAKARARGIVEEALASSDGTIIELRRYVPWHEALFGSGNPKAESALFVLFPDARNGYDLVCVPDGPGSYGQRLPLPESWCGLSGETLQDACGVDDAVFCHASGFMCAARSRRGVIELARLALEAGK